MAVHGSGTAVPAPRTSLIGRTDELDTLRNLILHADTRLLTLTGVGGCGKTRMAMQLATDLAPAFPHRLWLIELAPVVDPALLTIAIASVLGLREEAGDSSVETLASFLALQPALLILDNCEHLIDACATLVDYLLARCPTLRILATSREPIQIAGERQYRLAPLVVPDVGDLPGLALLACVPSVQLFVARAQAVAPTFALTAENAAVIARICARLDGIPLALELAAAWVRSLAPAQILERLDDVFNLLVGGSRVAPTRQQTLRAALDWSDALLTTEERALFHWLSVFVGEFTLDAVEAICAGDGQCVTDVLAVLTRLVDKSLVRVLSDARYVSYRLLEPVRQYAHEGLTTRGERATARARHAAYYLALAERAAAALRGLDQAEWLARLERAQGNLRAALGWAQEAGQWEIEARLAVALVPFWEAHAHLVEGVRWLRAALAALPAASAPLLRVRALNGAGRLAYFYEAGPGSYYVESERYQNESLALAREAGDRYGMAAAFIELGMIFRMRRDAQLSMTRLMEGLTIFRELNDEEGIAWALTNLGTTARLTGDYAHSKALLTESLALLQALGDHRRLAIAHTALGLTAMQQGQLTEAAGYFAAALTAHLHLGDRWFVIYDVMGIAEVFFLRGQPEAAVRLIGAAGALAAALGSSVGGVTYEPMMAMIRSLLSEARFAAIHAESAALTLAEAAALALALAEQPPPCMTDAAAASSPAPDTAPLTRREREIARLLARGATDRQIADALFISVGTVGWHVHHILQKLDLQSRYQVAAWINAHEPHDGAPPKTGQKT